jgi:hypothetical protein
VLSWQGKVDEVSVIIKNSDQVPVGFKESKRKFSRARTGFVDFAGQ